jgi:hypothetical protein
VLVKAFVWELVISYMSEVIARHKRSYGREEMIFDPLHYLSLLEQKANALYQAAPLQGWELPEEFTELRRQMEGRLRMGERDVIPVGIPGMSGRPRTRVARDRDAGLADRPRVVVSTPDHGALRWSLGRIGRAFGNRDARTPTGPLACGPLFGQHAAARPADVEDVHTGPPLELEERQLRCVRRRFVGSVLQMPGFVNEDRGEPQPALVLPVV